MIALVHALGIIPIEATGRLHELGPAVQAAKQINLPVSDMVDVWIENKTDLDFVFWYSTPSQGMSLQTVAASKNLTSRDILKSSRVDKSAYEAEAELGINFVSGGASSSKGDKKDKDKSGVGAPGANAKVAGKMARENHRSNESDHQRGDEQTQNLAIVLDNERRERELSHTTMIYAGSTFKKQLVKADHDTYWYFELYNEAELDRAESVADVKPYADRISYRTKYIEIVEHGEGRRLRPAVIMTPHEEVPSHLAPPVPPVAQCEHCLPIENNSAEALRNLSRAKIKIGNRSYHVRGPRPGDDIIWEAEDNSDSILVARKSLIGKQNPFILFHKRSAYEWFKRKNTAQQRQILQRLKARFYPYGHHTEHAGLINERRDYVRKLDAGDSENLYDVLLRDARPPGQEAKWKLKDATNEQIFELYYEGPRVFAGYHDKTWLEFFPTAKHFVNRLKEIDVAENYLEQVLVPEGSQTPFSIAGQAIQIVGECPHCHEKPNRHA